MGRIETNNFEASNVVLHAQNDRWVLGPMEISESGAICAVSNAQINRRCLGLIETCNSDPKVAVLHTKTTDEGWDP